MPKIKPLYVLQIEPEFEDEIKQKIKSIKKKHGLSIRRISTELILAGLVSKKF